MKTKLILLAAVIGAATTLSAHAGIRFGLSIGLPIPAPVVVVAPPVVVAAPVCAAPVVVATTVCPGPGYAWVPGYWSVNGYGRVWVGGGWRYHAAPVFYGHGYA